MRESSDEHTSLRQEWAETPPDVSYRFVVSRRSLRAAQAVASAARKKKEGRWKRALAFLSLLVAYYIIMTSYVMLVAWLSFRAALLLDVTVLRIVAFLVTFFGLNAGFRILFQRLSNYLSSGFIANSIATMNSCWRVGNRICGSKNDPQRPALLLCPRLRTYCGIEQ